MLPQFDSFLRNATPLVKEMNARADEFRESCTVEPTYDEAAHNVLSKVRSTA